MLERLHIGTSGWSYAHWAGLFYPAGAKPAAYLEYYATQFDCVELNASFYHVPTAKVVEGWARRTSPSFRFCAKVNRFITHRRKLVDVAEPLERFLAVFAPLGARLGPFLIQLPPSLAFDPQVASTFLGLLKPHQSTHEFAIEARHASWFGAEALGLLGSAGIGFVIADSGGCFVEGEAVTSSVVYLRFHGPGGLYSSPYSARELSKQAHRIRDWLAEGHHVWAFFNNDMEGHAVRNARELRDLVKATCA